MWKWITRSKPPTISRFLQLLFSPAKVRIFSGQTVPPTDIMPGYVKNGMVEDLTSAVDFSIMTEDALKLATIDEKQYSVPWLTMDSRACFYNKDIFEENGWEV